MPLAHFLGLILLILVQGFRLGSERPTFAIICDNHDHKFKIMEEDGLTWVSNIKSEEFLPLSSTISLHCSDDFAAACTFVATFTPSSHHTERPDEDGILSSILDTGATHCLLPLRWMTNEQAVQSKKIHLQVASGSKVRMLLHDNLIYWSNVTRPLISVGQLKSMLDLCFI